MSNDINEVILVGRLTRDPELRTLPSGATVCELGLASNESFKDSAGSWQEHANFIDVNVWNKQGEACAQYLSKGRQVIVHGSLRYRSWEAQDGSKRSKVEIRANQVQFLSDGSQSRSRQDDDIPYDDEPPPTTAVADDDEIPF